MQNTCETHATVSNSHYSGLYGLAGKNLKGF